jgi:type IV pilus assembly protein PilF
LTKKQILSFIVAVLSVALPACVTQEYENDETPVVKNQANRDDMAATRISLGLGYLRMGNMPQAKQNLEKAKKFSPEMVQVYTAFAHYYETVGENKLAIASFEQALSLKSDDADTLNNYGVFLCRQDQTESAEKQLLKAIAVPSYILVAKSYENLSSCFLQKDNFDKAEMYLYKAVMHSPGDSSILFQMVRVQYAMGKYTQAKSYEQRFEKVTRRFSPQSLALAYKVYLKLGQRRTAKSYGTMLVKMYPQSWEAQQYLLNELELIEADSLAKRYQSTQISETSTNSKKRVVKLSPKKALSNNAANSYSLVELEAANQKVLQASIVTGLTPTLTTTKIKTTTTIASSSISAATSSSINAALTMGSIETVTPVSKQKQVTVSQLPVNPSDQDKRVVVLMAPKLAKDKITKTLIANKEIPLEDREIFQTAKKPAFITENTPKLEEPLTIDSTQTRLSSDVSDKPPEIYVVTTGDTLFGISIKYNIKISALRRWNNLTSNKKIHINDKLHLIAPETVNK